MRVVEISVTKVYLVEITEFELVDLHTVFRYALSKKELDNSHRESWAKMLGFLETVR